ISDSSLFKTQSLLQGELRMTRTPHILPIRLLMDLILIVFLIGAGNSTMALNRVSVAVALLQSATASLSGTVVDENRYVIIDAQITVTNLDSGLQRELSTNKDGNFVASLLPPGRYSLVVQQNGFRKLEVRDIVLNV